ncbi:alkaline phosphatase [Robertkochia solimangrovi]|uniref:alkaline phosphatase n=1 Tax=Robertkochia solimangrovi TaxID=2213046 RepID=UPI00117EA460|nr:alkaline phosphatase [Robertkochia solimangrovi]TRZ44500.1 alkaline phosphatase [Robertkochia solimangrovi]
MKNATPILVFLMLLLKLSWLSAQHVYSVHSHNDYEQQYPFWYAYTAGAGSIEADVILKEGTLFVAHSIDEISSENTFERLYLKPLQQLAGNGELRSLQLLVDIKTAAEETLQAVVASIYNYPTLLNAGKVSFVISGNRPDQATYADYPNFISFDLQDPDGLETVDRSKIAMVSLNYKDYSVWNGYGRMVKNDLEKVTEVVEKVHNAGIPIRFWGTPDTKTAWSSFAKLGIDLINTDKPAVAVQYLSKLIERTYTRTEPIPVYIPEYKHKADRRPDNIIVMIGDGNGLAQISSAMIANRGSLSLLNLRDIGFLKTASYDNLNTDSAAGATAIATGHKTNNRAIGVDPKGRLLEDLIEITTGKGFNTGIVTTDAIFGATPSAFFAHRKERDDTKGLTSDLVDSDLGFFIAGGKQEVEAIAKRFTTVTLEDLKFGSAVYLGENKAPSVKEGRGNVFPDAVKQALKTLKNAKKPFFLMIEGAQIDNGGHSNDIEKIVEEMLDFDQAVAEVLEFIDRNPNTLVIITADHETSGLGIAGGDLSEGTIQADFLTIDHTGIMVPIFAYGPGSSEFRGVYENNEVFDRIINTLKLNTK